VSDRYSTALKGDGIEKGMTKTFHRSPAGIFGRPQWRVLIISCLLLLTFSGPVSSAQPSLRDLENANAAVPPSNIRALSPSYYDFIHALRAEGFVFWNFEKYWASDKSKLPEKLIVLRHDVHKRDIINAYGFANIEATLLSPQCSTYFVMLDFPPEMALSDYPQFRALYLKVIHDLHGKGFDVQPHISPVDMYLAANHPAWASYTVATLQNLFDINYQQIWGTNATTVIPTQKDVFDLTLINQTIATQLRKYNLIWRRDTGLAVKSYSAHGTNTPMNSALNNSIILDQLALLNTGLYQFDAYNSRIQVKLTYLTDNYLADWMSRPQLIPPGRYQLLAHPYLWDSTAKRSSPDDGDDGPE
jgi:hypothetical protein